MRLCGVVFYWKNKQVTAAGTDHSGKGTEIAADSVSQIRSTFIPIIILTSPSRLHPQGLLRLLPNPPNLALRMAMQFIIDFSEFKTNPLQEFVYNFSIF